MDQPNESALRKQAGMDKCFDDKHVTRPIPAGVSKGHKSDNPFFVYSGTPASRKALPAFLRNLHFSNIVVGWRDKHKKPGITLVCKNNIKQGTIVCYDDDLAAEATEEIKNYLDNLWSD